MQHVSAAAVRLEAARGLGDPLFDLLAPEIDRDIAALRALVIRMAPRVPGDRRLLPKESLPAWPAPHVIVFAKANEITYARTPQVRIGTNGDVVKVEESGQAASAATTTAAGEAKSRDATEATTPSQAAVSSSDQSAPGVAPVTAVDSGTAHSATSVPEAATSASASASQSAPARRDGPAAATPPTSPSSSGGARAEVSTPNTATTPAVVSNTVDAAPLPQTTPVFPAMASIRYDPADSSLATRSIDALVTAMKAVRGAETSFRAWLVADAGITSHLPARALVSLRKAGARELLVAACTKDGALVASPIRLVLASVDPAGETPDLKLRVRLGGYSLDVGHGVTDIPRVRDETGWRFDLPALHAQVSARPPRTAAVSFMTDVAAEQLIQAMREVAPSKAPIDLVIQ
jgi:hypothetical protein